ncbi:MAG TPA: hypothetical protein VLM05_02705, partial [Mycobacteriales bacterium]|nr:hypothetical protein [Mycobacteriales bacterium]
IVSLATTVVIGVGAPYYLRRVRLERPAIGTFNARDICVLFVLLAFLPVFYLHLPRWLLTSFLALTFCSALSIGLRPLLSPAKLWLTVGVLVGGNIFIGRTFLGTVHGWQVFWLENSVIVAMAAISVTNLYVQGGMKLKYVAGFAGALAIYDVFFTKYLPLTNQLVEKFLGYPLNPSMGFRWGFDNAAVGIGDLLVYGLFILAALKAYGKPGLRVGLTLVTLFGAVLPSLVPLVINFVDARTDVLVPAQAWFGPPAVLGYLWLRRKYGRERTVKEFLDSPDFIGRRPKTVTVPTPVPVAQPAPVPAPEPVGTPATAPAG